MILYVFNTQMSEKTVFTSVMSGYEWPSGCTSDRKVLGKYYMLLLVIMIILHLFLPEFFVRFLAVDNTENCNYTHNS